METNDGLDERTFSQSASINSRGSQHGIVDEAQANLALFQRFFASASKGLCPKQRLCETRYTGSASKQSHNSNWIGANPFCRLVATVAPKYSVGMKLLERITVEPGKCGGRPCIRGMRIRVKDVLDMLADGAKQEEILADFPDLQAEDIQACIAYAARYVDQSLLLTP